MRLVTVHQADRATPKLIKQTDLLPKMPVHSLSSLREHREHREDEFIDSKIVWSSADAVSNATTYTQLRRRPSTEFKKMETIPENI